MVHRAPDSRLLNNLIAHEKEYTKHLAALFPISHAALASLSAYAAASPSTNPSHSSSPLGTPGSSAAASPAQKLAAIVDILAGADNALQKYSQAVETWREQLLSLKVLEDDLNAVLRDREILFVVLVLVLPLPIANPVDSYCNSVTRLIKVSKSPKASRDVRSSLLVNTTASGSASFSSLPSTNSVTAGSTNTKLAQAQAELQACEAHLAAKEQALEARRISIARDGLGARCRALIDCGWVWGEMGKEGLRTLQVPTRVPSNGRAPKFYPRTLSPSPSRSTAAQKPPLSPALPPHVVNGPTAYSSDISSLTPSQSASQTAETSEEVPPIHDQVVESSRVTEKQKQKQSSSQRAQETRDVRQGDVTITLPPAHAIPELALPTGVWSQPQSQSRSISSHANGDVQERVQDPPDSRSAPRKKRTTHQGRPLSRHITEVADEDAEGLEDGHTNTTVHVLPTSRSTTRDVCTEGSASNDSSSDDEAVQGPLEVIDNTPFGQTKRPSVGASAVSAGFEADETATPGPTLSGPALFKGKSRERKTSVAFFGSLRGLFRHKPREHKGLAEWEDVGGTAQASPSIRNKGGGGGGRWVTRTDAHLKGFKGGGNDPDSESESTVVVPRASVSAVPPPVGGAKLRKSRTSSHHPSSPPAIITSANSSGWLTDGPTTAGPRGNIKRKKKSVAELRGRDEGHTDGEIEQGEEIGSRDRFNLVPGIKVGIGSGSPSYRSPPPGRSQEQQAPSPTRPTTQVSPVHSTASRRSSLSRTSILSAPSGTISSPRSHARSATMDFSSSGNGTSVRNGSSPGIPRRSISIAYASSSPHTYPGTTDAQGTSNVTQSKPKRNTRQGTLHTLHGATGNTSQSLMSIVEDVAKQNRDGWAAASVPPLPNGVGIATGKTQPVTLGSGRLQVPKAPSLGVPAGEREVANAGEKQTRSLDLPRVPSSLVSVSTPASQSRSMLSRRPSSSPPMNQVGVSNTVSSTLATANGHVSSSRPAKSPLRSALRNSSRTPSPSPAQLVELRGRVQEIVRPSVGGVEDPRRKFPERDLRSSLSPPSPRDSASISSYETGRENFDVEPEAMLFSPQATRAYSPSLPPPPPPHDDPPSSNASTETPLARRKSVRVSLHPTFSPTPPASYDNDEEAYAPWSKSSSVDGVGWKMKVGQVPDGDLWQDSSEEDEEYSRARRLLSRTGKREKGKGKA
ncbi:hypothetical protein PAXRUDRAFT_25520 [Paxillus rubicundulus Ve08.2h10]|uniref:Uncharacterized protein n=1 Tax=Paxillus rubicundulus Ve08.2h10 TaxID=930991 RepID=A0A0D0DDL5_9AGAM|nr:hypothetical protein PAXRUDRAFT_25520 [Paxillus rubicundulus Ve08.2h10]